MSAATLTRNEVVQRLRRAVSATRVVCELEFVILFGSYAYGEPHEGSDVDVLVVCPDEVSEEEQEKAKAVMREVFGGRLEVHPCRLSQWRQALLTRTTEEELKRWIEQVKSLRGFVGKTLNAHP